MNDPIAALCTMSHTAARYYLRRSLEPERKGTFPFMKLPAELRNMIYEMVLRFPSPGVVIAVGKLRGSLQSVVRMDSDDADYGPIESWVLDGTRRLFPDECNKENIEVNIAERDLSLLRVSKQIYGEAMPILYGLNAFFIHSTHAFYYSLIDRLSGPVIDSIRQVHLNTRPASYPVKPRHGYRQWEMVCQMLASMKLDLLVLTIDEFDWLEVPKWIRSELCSSLSQFTKVEQIPGFSDLAAAAAHATKCVLHDGDSRCPAIKKYLDEAIVSITGGSDQSQVKAKQRAKKRTPAKAI